MKKKNKNIESNSQGESKSIDDYIQLYTQIVRELSENLKNKTEMINNISNDKTEFYKALEFRNQCEELRNQRKLL